MYIICFLRDYLKTETLKKEESIRLSVESDQKIFDSKSKLFDMILKLFLNRKKRKVESL